MRYPIAIEVGDKRHAYGVVVPDLPGCFSLAIPWRRPLSNAPEAILLHLEGLLDDQKAVPKPSPLTSRQRKRDFKGCTWAVYAHAKRSGETRSGFLARAAIDAMRKPAPERT